MGYKIGCKNKVNGRAVSPVIATILMVAVIVIISTSIAAVSFGFTDQIGDPTPTATFDFAHDGEDWIITHTHGNTLEADRLEVQITEPNGDISTVEWPNSGTVSSGESVRISDYSEDTDLSILWEDDNRSATLARSTGSSTDSSSGGGGNPFDPVNNIPSDGSGLYLDGEFVNSIDWDGGNFEERENSDKVGVYTEGDVDAANFDMKENDNDVFVYTIGDFDVSNYIDFSDVKGDVHIYVGGEVDINALDSGFNPDSIEDDLILYGDDQDYDKLDGEEDRREDVEDWPDN